MREYETVFVTQPNLPEAQQKQIVDRCKSVIERNDGRVFFARDMGKKNLAYVVAKNSKGVYTCLDYAAKGPAVSEIERNLKLDENVLRFLTIVKREEVDVESRTAEIAAKGEDQVAAAVESVQIVEKDDSGEENSLDSVTEEA